MRRTVRIRIVTVREERTTRTVVPCPACAAERETPPRAPSAHLCGRPSRPDTKRVLPLAARLVLGSLLLTLGAPALSQTLYRGTFTSHCAVLGSCFEGAANSTKVFNIFENVAAGVTGTLEVSVPPGPLNNGVLKASEYVMQLGEPIATTFKSTATLATVGFGGAGEPYSVELRVQTRNFANATRPDLVCPQTGRVEGIKAGAGATVTVQKTCPWSVMGLFFSSSDLAIGSMFHFLNVTIFDKTGAQIGQTDTYTIRTYYEWLPAAPSPTVTSISPAVAPNSLTTPITATITGTNFTSGATVTAGDLPVRAVRFRSATALEVDLEVLNRSDGPREIRVTIPGSGTAIGTARFYVSSLLVDPLEINQGVKMACTEQVPCVADHRTIVRARVSCNAATCPSPTVTGRLHVLFAGTATPVTGSPFTPTPATIQLRPKGLPADAQSRHVASDALNFVFQGDATLLAGRYDLLFEIAPTSPDQPPSSPAPDETKNLLRKETGKLFRTSEAISVLVLPDPDDLKRGLPGMVSRLAELRFVAAAYPVSGSFLDVQLLPGLVQRLDRDIAQTLAALSLLLQIRDRPEDGNPRHLLFLPDSDSKFATSLCALGSDGPKLDLGCAYPASVMPTDSFDGKIAAHLLGHDYGLGDLPNAFAGPEGPTLGQDDRFEAKSFQSPLNPGCGLPDCASELGNFGVLGRLPRVSVPPEFPLYSFMGNSKAKLDSSWVDEATWNAVYGRLLPTPPTAARPAALADVELLFVSGGLTRAGTARFSVFTPFLAPVPVISSGDFTVELQGSAGEVLSSQRFSVDPELLDALEPDAELPFAAKLVWVAGASRVVLKHSGSVLATRAISASSPTVTLASPIGGETISGVSTIRWSASDADGDPLTYSLYYTTDATDWTPIAFRIAATSFAWDTALAQGTSTGRIKVVASDGVNEASAVSPGTFSVASKPPSAVVVAPAEGTVVLAGTAVTFEGFGFDVDEGILPSAALSFSSSRDGALGTGSTMTAAALSAGVHTITLTVTDRDGNRATDSITLVVFTPAAQPSASAFVPIVLSTQGIGGSFFTSELTLTNRGGTDAVVEIAYTQAFGGGSGVAYDRLPAGTQKVVPDALAYLASLGVVLPTEGNRGGTLSVKFHGLSSPQAGAATVRTTTPVADGRAGLSYPAVPPRLLTGAVTIGGLRQNATDRSNVAVMNAGSPEEGDVVLRITVHSGDPARPAVQALPDVGLAPGGFAQFSGILASNGLDLANGFVKVERISGTAPYYAYGVINDQATSDGSFIPPVLDSSLAGRRGLTVPVIVETGPFSSELVVTNASPARKSVRLAFVGDAVSTADNTATLTLDLAAGEQRIVPGFVQFLRDRGVAGIGHAGATYAGALFVTSADGGDVMGLVVGVRTASAAPDGKGSYGLFYTGVPYGGAASGSAWVYGLQQDAEDRANLALVNTGDVDASGSSYRIELYDGATGLLVKTLETSLPARRWTQLSRVLAFQAPGVTNAYAKVVRLSGNNQFLAYGVINDGGAPGQRSGDGAFVPMDVSD